jgi:5-methylthioadenosine/S-adenosylhomocysteine deaminase
MSLLLKDCRFVATQDKERSILEKRDILIEGSRISKIEKNLSGEGCDEIIDCSKSLVMPGLINTHTHIAMSSMRGLADDVVLEEFLEKTYLADSRMGEREVYSGALLGCLESVSFGTTTIADLYYSEDQIAKAAVQTGMRANLAWAILDKDKTTQKGDPVNNCESFVRKWGKKSELVTPGVGVQGVYAASEETYMRAKDIAERYGLKTHTHLSETRSEVYEHVKRAGMRPVEWLDKIGFLDGKLTAAHCVWLTKSEMDMLAKKGVSPSHNPTSNLKLASGGLCPVPKLIERGANVCLGTDSCASNNNLDMFSEMKLAAILHKNAKWDATLVSAQQAFDMATINGAKALGINSGSIEVGRLADLIIVNLDKPHLVPTNNLVSNIVYSMQGSDVDTSIIDGKVVMADKKMENSFKILDKLNNI